MIGKFGRFLNDRLGRKDELVFIHIGKCGGSTVLRAIQESPAAEHLRIRHVHIRRPHYNKRSNYLFVVRDPIERAVSAFNWRKKLTGQSVFQQTRFAGESGVLQRYDTINSLAEVLYRNGELNREAAAHYNRIHHLDMGIAFYLRGIERVSPEQVFAVLRQESLSEDIRRFLQVKTSLKEKDNSAARKPLSEEARDNLSRFLADDYNALARLDAIEGEARRLHPLSSL